jgi:hypothetical protein
MTLRELLERVEKENVDLDSVLYFKYDIFIRYDVKHVKFDTGWKNEPAVTFSE